MKTIKINYGESIPTNFTGIAEYPDGNKYWYKEGKLHSEDGPAIIYPDGRKYWYIENNFYSPERLLKLINTCFFSWKRKRKI